jgi:hypothetical protein
MLPIALEFVLPMSLNGSVDFQLEARSSRDHTNSASSYREHSDGVGGYSLAGQADHAHELVTAAYSASIWSLATLFSERVGENVRM